MQPSSLLGTGPLQGITSVTACLSSSPQMPFHDPNHQQQQQQHQHFTSQLDQQTSQQQHNNMDDLLEQMFSMPTWPEVAGGKAPWEYNANGSTTSNSATPNNQKFITMSLLPGQTLGSQESEDPSRDTNQLQYAYDESLLASRLRQHQLGGNSVINSTESNTSPGRSMVLQLSTGNPSHMLASLGNPPQANANTGCEGGMLPLPLSLGHGKPPDINEPRSRDDIEATFKSAANNVRDSSPSGGIYSPFVGTARPVRSAAPNFHSQAGQMPMQGYGGMPQTQPQPQSQHPPSNPVAATPARPNRVRARRGQATDPHSIAERLRRERIAERMKALQELVPNANKTDKASMLDEIIEYVKFLQLQVKVLSMSRLGGAGAVAPLVADISSEGANNSQAAALARANGGQGSSQDGLAMTERQVAKLMEEDMGSAMQYLQSKGLCLMPISLASAISGSGSRSQPGAPNHSLQGLLGSSNALEPTNSALSAITSVSVQPSIGSPASGLTETDNANKAGNGSTRNPKDSREANTMTKSNGIAPKKEDEPQRRTSQ